MTYEESTAKNHMHKNERRLFLSVGLENRNTDFLNTAGSENTITKFCKRSFDVLFSSLLCLLFLPFFLIGSVSSKFTFAKTVVAGLNQIPFHQYSFPVNTCPGFMLKSGLYQLPTLFNIFIGDMSFVGPLPTSMQELQQLDDVGRQRYKVKPGIVSSWWILSRANIDYGSELDSDLDYVQSHAFLKDMGILLRVIPAVLVHGKSNQESHDLTILNIHIDNITMSDAISRILDWADTDEHKQVAFVNADCANIAYNNKEYLEVLNHAELCLGDGIGIRLAAKIFGSDIVQNVNGTDMFPLLCNAISGTKKRVYFLGAKPEVIAGLVEWTSNNYPDLIIAGSHHGYYKATELNDVINNIRESDAHILLVAFGAPKQDLWIAENLPQTGARVGIGVGGLFDFYSGRIPRAPLWMRESGLEWLYRLIQEPGRLWKRYLIGNIVFLYRVVKSRIEK